MVSFPFETPALRVDQSIGAFFVAVLPAELVLRVGISDTMRAKLNQDGIGYTLDGSQRAIKDNRLTEIANYIQRVDAVFPNSIIIAANHDPQLGFDLGESEEIEQEKIVEKDTETLATETMSKVWEIEESDGDVCILRIPSDAKTAAIIDGQHRLFSFAKVDTDTLRSMKLLCSIFFDLPKALQAQLFATINSTQKRVDRSLTFELFGYNVDDEDEKYWTPDKLAVFLTRKLGTDENSCLKGHIFVAPKLDEGLKKLALQNTWTVSTAVVVDGILRLISSNPKRDSNKMKSDIALSRSHLKTGPKDNTPLRDVFIDGNDALLYTMVCNYLSACDQVFWQNSSNDSFIKRTVGVQALFDILRQLSTQSLNDKNVGISYFIKKLGNAGAIDFSDELFKVPAGKGRSKIRKAIEEKLDI